MTALWHVFALILRDQRPALLRGAALSLIVLLAGVSLLGLSGWFITAAAAAGLAGTGAVFDVFRPSALVRLLALGRTAARYGERVLTHDATLRALAGLRTDLLAGLMRAPYDRLVRLRGAQALNRLMADVDALDGVPLRLVLPIGAGLSALAITGLALWVLVHPAVAVWVAGGTVLGAALVLAWTGRRALTPSRRAEMAAQAFRSRFIDLVRTRADLAIYGRLTAQRDAVLAADLRRQAAREALDRIERRAGLALSVLGTAVAAGALGLGLHLARAGTITVPMAAIGFFAALALTEAVAPLRRAMADLGRMLLAARRVRPGLALPPVGPAPSGLLAGPLHGPCGLVLDNVGFQRPGAVRPVLAGLSLSVAPGETVALTGQSGSGKSTVLLLAAGLLDPGTGRVVLDGRPVKDWDEPALRDRLTLVPQRTALMAGTLREALQLAAQGAEDAHLWQALGAVALDQVIADKGGLDTPLGPGGSGLSGGEARRVALARAVLRQPAVLLLDEPTEGLDEPTARRVLAGLRAALPDAAILTASHRPAETGWADRVHPLARA
jgi:ATP-binding cassette, subfamily C, bacterial CydC